MKINEHLLNLLEESEIKGKKPNDYTQGIAERLLEKYKPSKGLSAIDGGRKDIEKGLAA